MVANSLYTKNVYAMQSTKSWDVSNHFLTFQAELLNTLLLSCMYCEDSCCLLFVYRRIGQRS